MVFDFICNISTTKPSDKQKKQNVNNDVDKRNNRIIIHNFVPLSFEYGCIIRYFDKNVKSNF